MAFRWEHFVNTFDARTAYTPGGALDSHGSKHTHYVREFASIVSEFQDRTDSLIDLYADLSRTIDELKTCAYTSEAFSTHLASIQKTIDNLNLEGFANLDTWVRTLDKKVEAVLAERLRATIDQWCTEFSKDAESKTHGESSLLARKKANAAKSVQSCFPLTDPDNAVSDVLFSADWRDGRRFHPQDGCSRSSHPEPSDLPQSADRRSSSVLVRSAAAMARRRVRLEPNPEFSLRNRAQDSFFHGRTADQLHFSCTSLSLLLVARPN